MAIFIRKCFFPAFQSDALQLCNKISSAIDRVDRMFTSEFDAEVDESESATLQQYYREAMIQCYNFGFEVGLAEVASIQVCHNARLP